MDVWLINKHGVMHSIPDSFPIPEGGRLATEAEIAEWKKAQAAKQAAKRAQDMDRRYVSMPAKLQAAVKLPADEA